MGCDIHSIIEVRRDDGLWQHFEEEIFPVEPERDAFGYEPFWWRHYELFAFLAGVRNEYGCTPISAPRGFPLESGYLQAETEYGTTNAQEIKRFQYHSVSWMSLKELLDFDYGTTFFHLRYKQHLSYVDFLGRRYFLLLDQLRLLGDPEAVRVVFWFDN